jgi:hypothetical protein
VSAGSIADDLILLALFPATDGWPIDDHGTLRVPSFLQAGVSVALLADLVLVGAVDVTGPGDHVSRTGRGVFGDAELSALAARIAVRPGQSAAYWAAQISAGGPEHRLLLSMRQRNLLLEYERDTGRLWWSKSVRRLFVREDDAIIARTVGRLGDALRHGQADEYTTALLAIAAACGLPRQYFQDVDKRERERRVHGLVGHHWAARATRQLLSL